MLHISVCILGNIAAVLIAATTFVTTSTFTINAISTCYIEVDGGGGVGEVR